MDFLHKLLGQKPNEDKAIEDKASSPPKQDVHNKKSAEGGTKKCRICDLEFPLSKGKQFTPRDISLMKPKNSGDMNTLIGVSAMIGTAAGIVRFDNPPGMADKPFYLTEMFTQSLPFRDLIMNLACYPDLILSMTCDSL